MEYQIKGNKSYITSQIYLIKNDVTTMLTLTTSFQKYMIIYNQDAL